MCAEKAILFGCLRALFPSHTIEVHAGASTLVVNGIVRCFLISGWFFLWWFGYLFGR
jgi:hypothetical protein